MISADYQGAICVFSFDDGRVTDYKMFQEFRKRGIPGTSFINGSRNIGDAYMTWAQMRIMERHELWNIECHSYEHVQLGNLTTAQVAEQMENNNQMFISRGLSIPTHHAYPFGNFNADTKSVVEQYRSTTRRTEGGREYPINSRAEIKDGISVWACGSDLKSQTSLSIAKSRIDYAIDNKAIIIFYGHGQAQDSDTPAYGNMHLLLDLVDYALTKNIRIGTMDDVLAIREST